MAGIPPPVDVSPSRLFRLLLKHQPRWALSFRFPFASDTALYARALSQSERRVLQDAQNRELHLVAASLCDEDGERVVSVREAGAMLPGESSRLTREIVAALDIIDPRFGRIDSDAWRRVLRIGASENPVDARALGSCFDVGFSRTSFRPDRFWGVPMCKLTDAKWLVYEVALEYYQRILKEASE